MKKLSLLFTLCLTIGFLFQQCKKEQGFEQSVTNYEHFSVIDGRLAFNSKADLDAVKEKLSLEQDQLAAWEATLSNFTSMRTAYAEMTAEKASDLINKLDDYKYLFTLVQEESGEQSVERNVDNDIMATFINKDGFLQIGDEVYRFTRDRYFKTDASNINMLKSNNIDTKNKNIQSVDIKRTSMMTDETVNGERAITWAECTNQVGNLRTKGIIEVEDLLDNDCNIITKHQKKVLGIWWANNTSISLSFSGTFVKIWSDCNPAPKASFGGAISSGNSSGVSLTVPGNHPAFMGCNGSAVPFHDGLYLSTHTAGGKTCTLTCPPGSPCN